MESIEHPRPTPPRPLPRVGIGERAATWTAWFGAGRLVAAVLAALAVSAAGYWLLRTPPAPPEASLPRATTTAVPGVEAPASTLPGPGAPTSVPDVVVHVAGAVATPGVYRLPAGSRVEAALAAAGGPAPDGDAGMVNLAAVLVDGQRLYVPRVGEAVPASAVPSPDASAPPAGPIDVNHATAGQLDELPGVGPATAAAIVRHREQHGPFASVEQLLDVPGIGPAKLAAFRELVTV